MIEKPNMVKKNKTKKTNSTSDDGDDFDPGRELSSDQRK